MTSSETTLIVIALLAVAVAVVAVVYAQREPAKPDISLQQAGQLIAAYYGLGV
jgi:hypothetical protein